MSAANEPDAWPQPLLTAMTHASFELGFRVAANWADRDDLIADIGSPAYSKDMAAALGSPALKVKP